MDDRRPFPFELGQNQTDQFPPPENVIESWQTDNVRSYVLMASGRIVAYAELHEKPQRMALEICHLLVDPARRGEGYGSAMLELLYRRAGQRKGVSQVLLTLLGPNRDILGCYTRAGFEIIGTTSHTPGLRMIRLVEETET